MNNYYSVLIYESELNENIYETIVNYVQKGTKVYYLTDDSKSEVEKFLDEIQISYLKYLEDNYMISLNYNIGIRKKCKSNLIFYDGSIPNDFREILKYNNFNVEQYDIEHSNEEAHVIVKAGAGTGKTKTMIDRSIYLRYKGYSTFREIVMITFTNKAAISMKSHLTKRLEAYYNITYDYKYLNWIDELNNMRIETIHAFSKEFIEKFGDIIKIDRNSKIKSLKYEKYKIIEEVINDYRFKYIDIYKKFKYIPQYKLINSIARIENYILNKGIDIIDDKEKLDFGYDDDEFNEFLKYVLFNLESRVKKLKEEDGVIEINDLVIKLRKFTNIYGKINTNDIKYIMVDEFQDSDTAQVEFIIWLIQTFSCKSFIVGDVKQSIYRFRGADYTAFIQFEEQLKKKIREDLIKKTLKKNYRSDKTIINNLNNFFSAISNANFNKEENKYFTFYEDDKLDSVIENYTFSNKINFFCKQESSVKDEVTDYIVDLVDKNNKYNILLDNDKSEDIAVLVRTNKDLEDIVSRLEEKGIVCKKEINGGFYRSIAIREFYIMLKALLYPKVYINQYAFINSSYGLGISNKEIFNKFNSSSNYLKKIVEQREEYKKLNCYRERLKYKPFIMILKEIVKDFEPDINYGIKKIKERKNNEEIENFIKQIKTSVINYKMNLMNLFTILDSKFVNIESNILDIEQFLNIMIRTDDIEDERMLSFNNYKYDLTCMTIHKAKGLEFDHVVIPKTNSRFINTYDDVNLFLNFNKNKIEIGYHIKLDEEKVVENNIYFKNIEEENKQVIAEEIRLLYVALTRAKKSLHIYKNKIVSNTGKLNNWMGLLERGDLKSE